MKTSVSPQELSGLIGAIYDCALDPTRWEATLGQVRQAIRAENASLSLQAMPSGTFQLTVTNNIDPEHLATMVGYGSEMIEMWGGLGAMMSYPIEEPAVLTWLQPIELLAKNRYYVEWGKPQGFVDVFGVIVARDAEAYGSIGFARHASQGPVTETDVETLRLFIPHLQRAVTISRFLDLQTIAARTFEAALDAVPTGIVLVDAALGIVHANRAATVMLTRGDPVSSERNRLRVRSDAGQEALAAAVRQAEVDESQIGRRGLGIPIRATRGDPAMLQVLPLKHGALRSGLSPRAAAAVFIAPGATPTPPPEQVLAALFDLTPSEARVFSLIASAKSVNETARALGIGESTVRTHLLRIFAKTGTRRQVELVTLAASLSAAG